MCDANNGKHELSYVNEFFFNLKNLKLNVGALEFELHPFDRLYLYGVIKKLSEWSHFERYTFYYINSHSPHNFKFDKKSIVFYLANEDHKIAEIM